MNEKVSIIIPTIRSSKYVERCIRLIKFHAGIPESDYEIITEVDKDKIGCPKMVKKLVEKTNYDLVMYLGEDVIPRSGFLREALLAMKQLPDGWGLVALNDEGGLRNQENKVANHWLADKRLL